MHNIEPAHLFTILAVASTAVLIILGMVAEARGRKVAAKTGAKDKAKSKSPAAAANGQEKTNNALAFLQTVKDQASQAESACSRASSGPRNSRLSAAEQAGYHAQAAQAAASSATSAAEGGPAPAAAAAAMARDIAAQAQGTADRARYNAATS